LGLCCDLEAEWHIGWQRVQSGCGPAPSLSWASASADSISRSHSMATRFQPFSV
jgi:hypothetical protein